MRQDALAYHSNGRRGKIELGITKACLTSRDLSLAYTPGVAWPVREIADRPECAYDYTAKGNLVAVVSNGSAILGLGAMGPLASKPVMEGKGIMFKRFADIDVFDMELDTTDPDEIIRTCQLMEPTFGGINLEDIKAPECFYIEDALKKTLHIPVFHDDQHGTAIIAGAGLLNALALARKEIETTRIVVNGAGAAGIACARFALSLGAGCDNITLCDSKGVVHAERTAGMNEHKAFFARHTARRTLAEALEGADVFIGVSVAGALSPEMLLNMAPDPVVFAMANPDPEIDFDLARQTRSDVIMATGRSDFFRGALDTMATEINDAMKHAAARALADLARKPVPDQVIKAYGGGTFSFGRDYIIPKPFDPRALPEVSVAVARAAIESGVARRQIDIPAYRETLIRQSRIVNNLPDDFQF